MAKKKTRGRKKKTHQRSAGTDRASAAKGGASAAGGDAEGDDAPGAETAADDAAQDAAGDAGGDAGDEAETSAKAGRDAESPAKGKAKAAGRGRRGPGAKGGQGPQQGGHHVDANIPSPDGENVSTVGGLYFVAIIFGLIGLAIVAQFFMG